MNKEQRSVTIVAHNALGKEKNTDRKKAEKQEKNKVRVRGEGDRGTLQANYLCSSTACSPLLGDNCTQIINNCHVRNTKSAFTLSKYLSDICGTFTVSLGKSIGQNLYSSSQNAVFSLSCFDVLIVVRNMEGSIWIG